MTVTADTASGRVEERKKRWQRYPAYKESGVEWLGAVPAHWDMRRLKYGTTINPDTLPEDVDPDYELEYIDIGNVDSVGNVLDTETYRFEDAPSRARRKVKDGDTFISTVRTYLRAIGYAENTPDNLVVSTGFAVLRPTSDLLPRFLWRLVQSDEFVETVVANSDGVSYPAINPSRLGELPLWIPPLDEQRAIAGFLDRETERIDTLIARKERLIELLQEKRTALISHAVTKGLDPDAPMQDSGVEWLGEVPAHWDVTLAKRVSSIFVPQRNKPTLNSSEGLPWITMEDLGNAAVNGAIATRFVTEDAASEAGSRMLPPECVIASCVGDFGVASVNTAPVIINQQLQAYVPNRVNPWFMRYLVNISKPYFEEVATATTLSYVNRESFSELPIVLPPEEEQHAIVAYLDRKTDQIDALADKTRQTIEALREYRTALISAAVTGTIDVRGEANSS